MKVLQLIHHLRIGGAERVFVDLCAALRDLGVDVIACSLSPGGPLLAELERRGVRHVQLRKDPLHTLRLRPAFDLARILARERVDVLHTHEFSASQWGRLAARLSPVPIVHTAHAVDGWIKPRKHRLVDAVLGKRFAKVVCVSEAVRRSLAGAYPPALLATIPNGIASARFAPPLAPTSSPPLSLPPSRREARAPLGLPADRFVIGTVGRLSREKGTDVFLRSLAELKRRRDGFLGLVIGDGAEKAALEGLIRDLGLGSHARMVGAVPDPLAYMAAFDAAVFASREESFGLALVEQAMFRTPTLAAAVGGIPALAGSLPGLRLVGKEDPEGIAARLAEWMDGPPVVPDAAGIILERFSIERTAGEYAAIYRACGDAARGTPTAMARPRAHASP